MSENTPENNAITSDLQRGLQPPAPNAQPSATGRDRLGRATARNTLRMTHGARSVQRRLAQIEARRGGLAPERAAILADLGGPENVSNIKARLVDRYLETSLIAEWLGGNLLLDGVLTTKGKTRAAATLYLQVVDRVHRLSLALGLERRARDLSCLTPQEWIAQQAQHEGQGASETAAGGPLGDEREPDREIPREDT